MSLARGDLSTFVTRPISAGIISLCVLLIALQIYMRIKRPKILPNPGSGMTQLGTPGE